MARPFGALVLAGATLVLLLSVPARAQAQGDSGRYDSPCVNAKAQQSAIACPSGTKATAGGAGKTPRSTVTAGGRQQEPVKRAAAKGPGVSDAIVADVRGGFRQKRESKARELLMREIDLTKRLIGTTRVGDPELPPRRLRLAQSYEDLLQEARTTVRALDEPIFEERRRGNKAQLQKLVQEQQSREKEVSRWRDEAIKQYAALAQNHPDYPNRDEVLFRLAFMIEEQAADDRIMSEAAGRPVPSKAERELRERGRRVYHALIKAYPNSRYIPNAYLSFAEFYFQEGDMEASLRFYERVVQYEDSEVFGYAVYKMAWVYINLQNDREAVNQFVRVIQYADANPDARIARPLARQARRELIAPFSREFGPSRAWEFFQRVGGDMALEMMELLAEFYYNQGQWNDATAAYHSLMAQNPTSHRLCFYQARVAEASRRGRPKADQVLELTRTVDLMNTFLAAEHPAEAEQECRQAVAQMIMEVATNWHQEAVGSDTAPGTNDEETMTLASRLYRLAVDNFEDMDSLRFEGWEDDARPTFYRVSYWMAELLWKRNQWSECGPAFDRVVQIDPAGEYVRDAAYAAVLCYNNLYQDQHTDDTSKRGAGAKRPAGKRGKRGAAADEGEAAELERLRRRDFTALEEGMLTAYTRYVCYVSDSDDLVRIKYRRARIHYEANHWDEAAVLFRDIAYNHSSDELAPYAANLYLDSLNAVSRLDRERRIGCRDELADAVEHFLGDSNLMRDTEFQTQVSQLQCGILWLRADAYREAQRFREAADLYVRIYRDFRDQCQVIGDGHGLDEVLYNAAISFEADYRIGAAIQIRRRLMIEFGDESPGGATSWAKKAIYQIGGNYHAIAAYTKAADYYEDFARRFPGEDDAPDALRNATVFRLGLGQDSKAIQNSEMFERNYAKRFKAQTATVVFSVGTIYMRRESWRDAEKHYDSFIRRYGREGSTDDVVQAYTNLGFSRWKQEGRVREKAAADFRKAVALADRGRSEGEELKARLARYRGMIEPVGASEEDRNTDATARLLRMVDSVAKARFYLGEEAYLRFQAIDFPAFRSERQLPAAIKRWYSKEIGSAKARDWEQMLRFMEPEDRRNQIGSVQFQHWVKNRFIDWMDRKQGAMDAATKLYVEAIGEDVPAWEIAAAARLGDMFQSFMQSLYDAPIDPSIAEDQELVDIYRDALDEKARPFRDQAIEAFQHCIGVATENRWFNEWSRSCESSLNKLDPRQYPLSDELRAQPGYERSPLAEPVLIDRLRTTEEREAEQAEAQAGAQE